MEPLGKTIIAEPEGQLYYEMPEHYKALERATKIPIDNRWWKYIKNGSKVVEVKKNSDTWKSVKEGSHVNFIDETSNCSVLKRVESVEVYKDIASLLLNEGLNRVLPDVTTISEGVKLYEGLWPTLEDQSIIAKHGLKAIRLTGL